MRLIDADALKQDLLRKSFFPAMVSASIRNTPTVNPYEWISVEDRLPEEKTNCLVHYKHTYCDDDGYWAIGVSFYDGIEFQVGLAYKVTHWVPLPTPPTEKEN